MRERKSASAEDIEILLIKNQLSAISCCGDVTFPTQNVFFANNGFSSLKSATE